MTTTSTIPASAPPGDGTAQGRFGLASASASALVVGSVIGTGVFALPSALASHGPISLVAFGKCIALILEKASTRTRWGSPLQRLAPGDCVAHHDEDGAGRDGVAVM